MVSTEFLSNSKVNASSIAELFYYFHADQGIVHDHLKDVPWENNFTLCDPAGAPIFCCWVQVRTDVCIPRQKYQVIAVVAHRNYSFCLTQQNKSV